MRSRNAEGFNRHSERFMPSSLCAVNGNEEYELLVEREDEEEERQTEIEATEEEEEEEMSEEEQEQFLIDESYMRLAIDYAKSRSEEAGAYPNPVVGAALVASDGQVLGLGCSSYKKDAIQDALQKSGLDAMPLREWCVTWPADSAACWKLRDDLAGATLYVTLEPLASRRGEMLPPMTQLIDLSGVSRVVIGTPDPVPERTGKGSQTLHRQNGLDVIMGTVLEEECRELVQPYMERANTKLMIMARNHRKRTGRPLGLLHCSVVDSDDIEAFAQLGNAFGKSFGGQTLSFRDFGSYEMAPPPEQIWAMDDEDEDEDDDVIFKDESATKLSNRDVIMPYYSQVDAVIATFPREGNNGRYCLLWKCQICLNLFLVLTLNYSDSQCDSIFTLFYRPNGREQYCQVSIEWTQMAIYLWNRAAQGCRTHSSAGCDRFGKSSSEQR